jgi:hypothetical protein
MQTMMPGVPQAFISGAIYALPPKAGRLLVTIGTATSIAFSTSPTMATSATVAAAGFQNAGAFASGIDVADAFVQAVGGTAVITWVPY